MSNGYNVFYKEVFDFLLIYQVVFRSNNNSRKSVYQGFEPLFYSRLFEGAGPDKPVCLCECFVLPSLPFPTNSLEQYYCSKCYLNNGAQFILRAKVRQMMLMSQGRAARVANSRSQKSFNRMPFLGALLEKAPAKPTIYAQPTIGPRKMTEAMMYRLICIS